MNLKLGFPSLTLNPVYPDIKKKLDPKRDTDKIFNTREIKKDPFKKYLNSILLKNIPLSFLEQYVYIKNFTVNIDQNCDMNNNIVDQKFFDEMVQ